MKFLFQIETTTETAAFSHRLASRVDVTALQSLIDQSIRVLLRQHVSAEETAACFSIMGLDTQLIDDGTYFVVEANGRIAGCGGWSRRATLFGGDHTTGRSDALLKPPHDAARIRAMYTHPDFARKGVGRLILSLCEEAASVQGFRRFELAATMSGLPLYRSCGYRETQRFLAQTPSGVSVPLVLMTKGATV